MKLSEIARAAPFAHLLGLNARRVQAEDDEEEKKSRRAKADEDEKEAEDEEDAEDESDEKKKSKKAKRAKANDDEPEDAKACGRRLERARCQAIFASCAAGARPDVAAHLAFETDMPSTDAIALLASVAAGAPARRGLDERMAAVKNPDVGVEAGIAAPNNPRTLAAQIVAAGKKARNEA